MHDKYLETLDNPFMIYISEPFGFCSFYSTPFDDLEVLMPFLTDRQTNYFDITKAPKIKTIKFLYDENKHINAWRTTYLIPTGK
jgi:hypothetical protein